MTLMTVVLALVAFMVGVIYGVMGAWWLMGRDGHGE